MKRGLCAYARLVASLKAQPSTASEVQSRFGVTESHARRVPRALLDLGVLSVVDWRREKPKGPAMRVFGVAQGITVRQEVPTISGQPSKHCGAKARSRYLRPEMIAFAAVWDALLDPLTLRELSEETGVGFRTMACLLRELSRVGLIGVFGWTRKRDAGVYSAQYRRGVTRNAPKPAPKPLRLVLKQYRKRASDRRMNELLGGSERLAA